MHPPTEGLNGVTDDGRVTRGGDQKVFIFDPSVNPPPCNEKDLKSKVFRLWRAFIVPLYYILVLKLRRKFQY